MFDATPQHRACYGGVTPGKAKSEYPAASDIGGGLVSQVKVRASRHASAIKIFNVLNQVIH